MTLAWWCSAMRRRRGSSACGTKPLSAISGYAGPEGGDDGTAAGTVCFGWNIRGQTETRTVLFSGECQDVVDKAVRYSLSELIEILSGWDNV